MLAARHDDDDDDDEIPLSLHDSSRYSGRSE